jgi:MoaA/NifB/PqqE/SkfB family radical SAM enzyme
MANLTISAVCNQHCPYCFTSDHLNGSRANQSFLEIGDFETRLDFLDRSDIDQVRLLGGEPTLHPQFPGLIERARARNKKIVVFTNGLMREEALVCLEKLPATECTVLVNVNEPAEAGEESFERQRATIRRLGERALLGFNIYRTDFQPGFLLSLIAETGSRPAIRLGLAQPCLSGDNRYIHPNQYVAIGEKIVRFAKVAARASVTVEFDCGFVRCMFSDADLKTLEALGADVGWRCNPILDVDIDGRVIHCYPLSRLGGLPLTPETDAPALRIAFESLTRPYRQAGVFQECSTCPFKRSGVCPGGCLAATIRRFRHTPMQLSTDLVLPRQGTGS